MTSTASITRLCFFVFLISAELADVFIIAVTLHRFEPKSLTFDKSVTFEFSFLQE